jgi:hypothetical protein
MSGSAKGSIGGGRMTRKRRAAEAAVASAELARGSESGGVRMRRRRIGGVIATAEKTRALYVQWYGETDRRTLKIDEQLADMRARLALLDGPEVV